MKEPLEYQKMRAKNGQGAVKKKLIEEYRMYTSCLLHSTIMCSGDNPPKEWLDQKADFKKKSEELAIELESILIIK